MKKISVKELTKELMEKYGVVSLDEIARKAQKLEKEKKLKSIEGQRVKKIHNKNLEKVGKKPTVEVTNQSIQSWIEKMEELGRLIKARKVVLIGDSYYEYEKIKDCLAKHNIVLIS